MFVQRLIILDGAARLQEAANGLSWSSSIKDPQRLAAMATAFATQAEKELYACIDGGRMAGLVALDHVTSPTVTICQVGVHPSVRRRGIGRRMVGHGAGVHALGVLQAETDLDAVDFYRRLGFTVQSLGEKYPGIERFCCTLAPLQERRARQACHADGAVQEQLQLRPTRSEDLSEVAELYVSVFSAPPWNEQHGVETAAKSLRAIIDHPAFYGMVATASGRLVGAALGHRGEDSGSRYRLRELFVDVANQRWGIGGALLSALEQQLCDAGVTTISLMTVGDSAAHAFYAAQGYREVSRRVMLEKGIHSTLESRVSCNKGALS